MMKERSKTVSMILAITGVVTTPVILFVEVTSWFLVAMVISEPANSVTIKTLTVIALVILALMGLVLPSFAFAWNKAVVSRVIAGITILGWLVIQLYMLGLASGACSFEGCFPA